MLKTCRVGLMLLLATTVSISLFGQNYFFAEAKEPVPANAGEKRVIVPDIFKRVVLDSRAMEVFLKTVPRETIQLNRFSAPVLQLPLPYGGTAKYRIWESSVLEPALAARFPGIRTFTGQGIDDPTATIKIDLTELGFHAMVLSAITGDIFIDPFTLDDTRNYIVYYKTDLKNKEPFNEIGLIAPNEKQKPATANRPMAGPCVGPQLKSYRLAIACTGEYARAATGLNSPTIAQTLAAIVTSINRVDGVFEKELAISLQIVANNSLIVFTNPGTDPFTANNDGSALLDESQTVITQNIGTANFDIGHTFSTGAGGIAQLETACGSSKARGVTGSSSPVGDPYDIDYVAHELGHQLGANHTFNAVTSTCSGNRSDNTAVEPGSGVTIMSYAGLCASNDLAQNSMPFFHAVSMDEINTFTTSGSGASCAVLTATGNTAPDVDAGDDYIIPVSTTFLLTGSATDADGDALTYSWEQMDTGPAGSWNTPSGNAPLFRSFAPQVNPTRHFPRLADQVRKTNTIGERLPTYSRDLNFRLTVRDNRAGGGGVCFDESIVAVDETSGPFVVNFPSAPGISWEAGTLHTVSWDVANTNNAPVNCTNVSIQLSLDSGYTFPVTLLANTPNDGSEQITIPANFTTRARIRVMAIGNIFYDMSDNNFEITTPGMGPLVTTQPQSKQVCENETVQFNVEAASPVLSYQWQVSTNGGVSFTNIDNATGATLLLSNVDISLADNQYRVLLTGPTGVTISDAAVLIVHGLPTVSLVPSSTTNLTPGLTTTLTGTASGSPGGDLTINWLLDQTPISVAGNSLTVDVSDLGSYQVNVEETWADGNICVNESQVVTITAKSSNQLFIYPNPNDGRFTVSFFNAIPGNTRQTVVVYDAKGAKVYSKLFTFSGPYELHEIDLTGKARGVYFVVIGDANGKKIADGKMLINY